MKKLLIVMSFFIFTSCSITKDSMEDITIYTTIYPIEYITNKLYSNYSEVLSVYPNQKIELSDKLLENYSKGDLFIYNGLSDEKDYAVKMLNNNKNLMIVDSSMGMEYSSEEIELWINPSNFLMLAQNIRNGMKEYITSIYLKNEIDKNYEQIRIEVSELDAEFKLTVENGNNNTILIGNDSLLFLEKYNLNIFSLSNKNLSDKNLNDAKAFIKDNKIKYILLFEKDVLDEKINSLLTEFKLEKIYFHDLTNISETEKNNNENYITIMNDNINVLKKKLYE